MRTGSGVSQTDLPHAQLWGGPSPSLVLHVRIWEKNSYIPLGAVLKDLNLETILKHLVENVRHGTFSVVTAFASGRKDEKAHFRDKGTS